MLRLLHVVSSAHRWVGGISCSLLLALGCHLAFSFMFPLRIHKPLVTLNCSFVNWPSACFYLSSRYDRCIPLIFHIFAVIFPLPSRYDCRSLLILYLFAACSHLPSRTIAVVPWLRTFLLPAFTCLHVRLLWSCDFTHFCRLLSLAFTYDCCGPLISYIFAACFHWQVFHCSTSHDSHLVKSLYELLKFIETSTLLLLIVDFN